MAVYPSIQSWVRTLSGTPVRPPAPTSSILTSGSSFSAVTFGSFTDPSGFIDGYSASVTNVRGPVATISGSGLGPYTISNAADGTELIITLSALNGAGEVLASTTWSGSIESSGASWVDVLDLDLTDLTTASALSVGTSSLGFESSEDTVSVYFERLNGGAGAYATPTNGTGLVFDGGTDTSSSASVSFLVSSLFSSFTLYDVRNYKYAVHFVIEDIDISYSAGNSGYLVLINQGSNNGFTGNSARGKEYQSVSGGLTESERIRNNTSTYAWRSQNAQTSKVVTITFSGGLVVQAGEVAGTTPPTPDVANYGIIGADAGGLNSGGEPYQTNGLRVVAACVDGGSFTLSRIYVQRFQ